MKSRPLTTVFSLAQFQVLDGQYPKDDIVNGVAAVTLGSDAAGEIEENVSGSSSVVTGKVGCVSCGISSFGDAESQREHVKCDWHRYNVKMRVLGRPAVGEDEFDALVEDDDVASISGSDDEYEDEYDESESRENQGGSLGPYCIFRVRAGDSDPQSVGFWKCLAIPDARSRQTPTTKAVYDDFCLAMEETQRWAVIMLQGGHFAAAVYEVVKPSDKVLGADTKTHGELTDLCMREVQHKSFHRYVVRAKAGGKQSDKDATGKFAVRVDCHHGPCLSSPRLAPSPLSAHARLRLRTHPPPPLLLLLPLPQKSAGSRLRRYNEAILKQEILETLAEWKNVLDGCSMIFMSCPGSNRLVLFDKESSLDKADVRLRRIPFIVRRPTVSETKRVVKTLLTVYSFDPGEDSDVEAGRKREERAAKESAQAERLRLAEEQRQAAKLELQRQEEINKAKNKEKKQKQKDRRKLKNQKELEAREAAARDADEAEDVDEQLKLLAVAVGSKPKKSPADSKTSASGSKARSMSKPDDVAARRQKLAEAAEKRAAALAAASASQKFY